MLPTYVGRQSDFHYICDPALALSIFSLDANSRHVSQTARDTFNHNHARTYNPPLIHFLDRVSDPRFRCLFLHASAIFLIPCSLLSASRRIRNAPSMPHTHTPVAGTFHQTNTGRQYTPVTPVSRRTRLLKNVAPLCSVSELTCVLPSIRLVTETDRIRFRTQLTIL